MLCVNELSACDRSTADVQHLMALCVYRPEEGDHLSSAIERYGSADYRLLGAWFCGQLVGLIGIRDEGSAVEVVHIAVATEHRHQNIGRKLLEHVRLLHPRASLVAETDRDAVAFYQKCGFACESLGEQYPDVERFRCVLGPKVPSTERAAESFSAKGSSRPSTWSTC